MKIKIKTHEKCTRKLCKFAGAQNCLEFKSHSLFFCNKCELSFKGSDDLKFHNEKVHEGLFYTCEYCDSYSTARGKDLKRPIFAKHSDEDLKQRRTRSCEEERVHMYTKS